MLEANFTLSIVGLSSGRQVGISGNCLHLSVTIFFPRICFSQLGNFTLGLFINGIDRYKGGGDEQKGLCFYRN